MAVNDLAGQEAPWLMMNAPRETFWGMLEMTERELLYKHGRIRRFSPHTFLCRQGETLQHVFIVLSGQIQIEAHTKDGRQAIIAIHNPGDVLGELSPIDGKPRSATAQAISKVTTLVIPAQQFTTLIKDYPKVTWAVLQVVVKRFREVNQWRIELVNGSSTMRVALALMEIAKQRGLSTQDGIKVAALTQNDLAAMIGISRVSVARIFRELRACGLIKTGREHILIPQIDSLQKWVDSIEQ